jgi:hypothetical protein
MFLTPLPPRDIPMAAGGDSGSGLYGISGDGNDFVFGGLLVSIFCAQ